VALGSLRRGLVVGALIALALRADLPRRLLELYQSLTGATATGDRTGASAGTDRDAAVADTGVIAAVIGTEVESGDVGVDDVRRAETGVAGEEGVDEAAVLDVDAEARTEASRAAGYGVPEPAAGPMPGTADAAATSTEAGEAAGYGEPVASTGSAADAAAASTEASDAAGYDAPEGGSLPERGAEAVAVTSTDPAELPGYGGPDLDLAAVTDVRNRDDIAPGLADADVDAIDVEADLPEPDAELIADEPPIIDGDTGDAPTDLGIDMTGDVEGPGWSIVDEADDAELERAGITGRAVDSAGDPIDEAADEQPIPHVATDVDDAVPGDGTTECPEGFPVKGNDRSRLYHMLGGNAYARTKADVCFRTPEAAERAGYRPAQS
jgi:hypothetical protein